MQVAFRLAYALVLAILLVLFVILGFRLAYPEPESPWERQPIPVGPSQPSQRDIEAYQREQREHDRNVLIVASVLGAAVVALGLYAHRRAAPLGLGLMLGAVGIVSYGWAQAGERFDEMGATAPFVAVGLGLAVVMGAGWFFLQAEGAQAGNS